MKLKVYHPGLCICILHYLRLNFAIIMHLERIAWVVTIVFQICSVHYLLRGDTVDIRFEDDNSLLGESDGADEN